MAVDVCSEISSPGISPRISFSHDLKDCDGVPVDDSYRRSDGYLLESSSNFDFCIGATFIQELSSAEELFANGKMLPVEIKKAKVEGLPRTRHESVTPPAHPRVSCDAGSEKKRLKEFLLSSSDTEEIEDPPQSKSFWQFKRSNSLNCEINRSRGLIRSLHFLSRSNSTGSALNPKQHSIPKENPRQGQSFQRQQSIPGRKSSFGMPYPYGSWQQQQQKANPPHRKGYGNGVRISPVLNFQPSISIGTVNLLGLGSLFCNGKVKRKKKK